MHTETLPSLRPEQSNVVQAHADPRIGQRSPIKLSLEPMIDQPTGYKAAYSFFHHEHKVEIDLLASNVEELRMLKAILCHEHQEKTSLLASLLDEVRQLRESVQASNILAV